MPMVVLNVTRRSNLRLKVTRNVSWRVESCWIQWHQGGRASGGPYSASASLSALAGSPGRRTVVRVGELLKPQVDDGNVVGEKIRDNNRLNAK